MDELNRVASKPMVTPTLFVGIDIAKKLEELFGSSEYYCENCNSPANVKVDYLNIEGVGEKIKKAVCQRCFKEAVSMEYKKIQWLVGYLQNALSELETYIHAPIIGWKYDEEIQKKQGMPQRVEFENMENLLKEIVSLKEQHFMIEALDNMSQAALVYRQDYEVVNDFYKRFVGVVIDVLTKVLQQAEYKLQLQDQYKSMQALQKKIEELELMRIDLNNQRKIFAEITTEKDKFIERVDKLSRFIRLSLNTSLFPDEVERSLLIMAIVEGEFERSQFKAITNLVFAGDSEPHIESLKRKSLLREEFGKIKLNEEELMKYVEKIEGTDFAKSARGELSELVKPIPEEKEKGQVNK